MQETKDNIKPLNKDLKYSSDDFVKMDLNISGIEKIKIIKKEGAPFKEDDVIVKYILKGEKDIKFIKSPIYGWIVKYEEDDKILILEKCKHEMVYINLCTKCGYKKTENDEFKAYGFTNKEFFFSKEKAESLEKTKVQDYLTSKKLILLLDLDNTILHCSSVSISSEQIKFLEGKYSTYISKIPIKNNMINRYETILIKFRPFLRTFLKNIKNKFEIFVYTQATKEYATGVIQYVNTNFVKDILSTTRMIPRVLDENGFAENKSIKNVFPTQEKMILIIDDNMEVWKESGNNFIGIYPYRFFSEREKITNKLIFINNFEKNYTKDSFYKIEHDNVLFCITNLLLNVHRKFFAFYEKNQITKSISRITNDTLKLILLRKKFYYHLNFDKSDLFIKKNKKKKEKDNDSNENKKESNDKEINKESDNSKINEDKKENNNEQINKINEDKNTEIKNNTKNLLKFKIQKLGGELIEEEKDMFNADYILTDFYDLNDETFKNIENYKEKKIPVLHSHYIEICSMYYYAVKTEDFILTQQNNYLKFLDLNKVFEKNKVDIIKFYKNDEFVDEN